MIDPCSQTVRLFVMLGALRMRVYAPRLEHLALLNWSHVASIAQNVIEFIPLENIRILTAPQSTFQKGYPDVQVEKSWERPLRHSIRILDWTLFWWVLPLWSKGVLEWSYFIIRSIGRWGGSAWVIWRWCNRARQAMHDIRAALSVGTKQDIMTSGIMISQGQWCRTTDRPR
jgi:hypothetical protein